MAAAADVKIATKRVKHLAARVKHDGVWHEFATLAEAYDFMFGYAPKDGKKTHRIYIGVTEVMRRDFERAKVKTRCSFSEMGRRLLELAKIGKLQAVTFAVEE